MAQHIDAPTGPAFPVSTEQPVDPSFAETHRKSLISNLLSLNPELAAKHAAHLIEDTKEGAIWLASEIRKLGNEELRRFTCLMENTKDILKSGIHP